MAGRRKKRFWSDDEKRSICRQSVVPGVSVAQVARRHALNANLIFKWLKDPRFTPDVMEVSVQPEFLPVAVAPPAALPDPSLPRVALPQEGRIEIALAGGHRISATGNLDPDVLARLLKGLTT